MIKYVRGKLVEKKSGSAVVDVSGMGYGLAMTSTAIDHLPPLGEEVCIHTHFHVREEIMTLYGFLTPQERDAFGVITHISGIGPKTGLFILSTYSIDQFASAIMQGNTVALTKIPGIGKKTAERIILEMKDKIGGLPAMAHIDFAPALNETARDAVDALIALQMKPQAAESAVAQAQKILGEKVTLEELIRESLKYR